MPIIGTALAGGLLSAGAIRLLQRRHRRSSLGQILATPPPGPVAGPTAQPVGALQQCSAAQAARPGPPPSRLQSLLGALSPAQLLAGDPRRRQLAELTGQPVERSERERRTDHFLGVSVAAMAISGTAVVFHSPLVLLSVPLLGYLCIPIVDDTLRAFEEKQQRWLRLFEVVTIGGELLLGFYFASALSTTLYMAAERAMLQAEDRSQKSLITIFGQQPQTVWVLIDGAEREFAAAELEAGHWVVVNAGEMIPVDGLVIDGNLSIDQHQLTGEAQPVEKSSGDRVLASTMALAGRAVIAVEQAGSETAAAKLGTILNQSLTYKEKLGLRGVTFMERFIPLTLGLGLISFPFLGANRALALVESGFGYNLHISGPLSLVNVLQIAARQGVLIKDASALERLPKIDTVVFDKTGTLTLEQPEVAAVYTTPGFDEATVLTWAAAAEFRQVHPIARAILQAAHQRSLPLPAIDDAHYHVGYGIQVRLDGRTLRVGNDRFMELQGVALPEQMRQLQATCHQRGYSVVFVARDHELTGALEIRPAIRPEAAAVVRELKQRNLAVYVISGDHDEPTRQLAQSLDIDRYVAQVLPQDKSALVKQLQQEGRVVCFVGDGINDAIALAQANLSISLRGAATAATDTAQVVLMDASLSHLVGFLDLGREFEDLMRGNSMLATVPSVVCIGGVLLLKWGLAPALMLYNVSLIGSLGNSFLPLLTHWREKRSGPAEG